MKKVGLLLLIGLVISGCGKKEDEFGVDVSNYTVVTCTGPYSYINEDEYPKIIKMDAISKTYYDENDKAVKSAGGYTIELDSNISDSELKTYKENLKEFCPESNKYCDITDEKNIITLKAEYSSEYLEDEVFNNSPEDFKTLMETVNENVTCSIETNIK